LKVSSEPTQLPLDRWRRGERLLHGKLNHPVDVLRQMRSGVSTPKQLFEKAGEAGDPGKEGKSLASRLVWIFTSGTGERTHTTEGTDEVFAFGRPVWTDGVLPDQNGLHFPSGKFYVRSDAPQYPLKRFAILPGYTDDRFNIRSQSEGQIPVGQWVNIQRDAVSIYLPLRFHARNPDTPIADTGGTEVEAAGLWPLGYVLPSF
jgi:hypothetical protein